jgi:hypothetical protein
MPTVEQANVGQLNSEQLQVIETGWGSEVESALLAELLQRSLRLDLNRADPTEIQNEDNPLARMNAYKHRVHSLRCAYADARLHGIELEEQLAETHLQVQRLQAQIHHLQGTLEQIYATRWWKFRERGARCWRTLLKWLRQSSDQKQSQ